MYFEELTDPQHTGTERYTARFAIKEQGDLYDVRGAFVTYTIRPDTLYLVWERETFDGVKTPWKRPGYRPRGVFSSIAGGRVLKNNTVSTNGSQRSFVEVFTSSEVGGPLTKYAASLPHLEQLVEMLEKQLPA